jgi:hypothetical protein
MYLIWQRSVRVIAACLLVAVGFPAQMLAEYHVAGSADLQREVIAASQARQNNVNNLSKILSGPEAEKAMKAAKIDPARVKTAIASLSDSELAQLSARASKAQADFAAGTMSDRDLLLILVGVAVLILIIVAVR